MRFSSVPRRHEEDRGKPADGSQARKAAFEDLVRRDRARLLGVARRFFLNEEDARDAVQDALLSAYRSLDAFAGRASLSTWARRILINACLMKLRARRRRREVALDEAVQWAGETLMRTREDSWETALDRARTRARVRDSVARLPDRYRSIIVLRDFEERDTRETARLLGLTEGAVKLRLFRARRALRGLIVEQASPT